jgi:hypothetical protein
MSPQINSLIKPTILEICRPMLSLYFFAIILMVEKKETPYINNIEYNTNYSAIWNK